MKSRINIAIDGYSSCGKSTLAKELAADLEYIYVDTGAMYRAVALFALNNNCFNKEVLDEKALRNQLDSISIVFKNNSDNKPEVHLNDQNVETEIREMRVSQKVSSVAAVKEVRKLLVAQQQEMGKHKGVVMDGRDIGTVVFPDAELKIFMTASHEVRTRRRYDELVQQGKTVTLDEVSENLEQRDHLDTTRKEDPLRQAPDALVLDNSNMSRAEQLRTALTWAKERINQAK